MSQSSRSTVFLQEMGIGVQWKVRHGAPQDDGFDAAVQALADGLPADAAPVAVAPPVVAAPAPMPVQVPVPVVAAAPAPAPIAAAPAAPATPATNSDEDTAWFDAAPVPAPAVAPAPRPAPASRPAPAAAQRTTQPESAPQEEESTAWFDDVPMPPAVAPDAAGARRAPVSDEAIADMDWPTLQAAVSSCTRCPLCETRRVAVNGRGAENARFFAIAAAPSAQDEQDAQPVSGEAGQLLNNMLKAIELKPDADVYVATLVKCRPSTPDGADRHPTADELLACRPFLDRELALAGAGMAMTFGQFAAKGLMLGAAARGKVMHYGARKLPVVATYHPDDLLRKPEDKAKAWADLCLAKTSHG